MTIDESRKHYPFISYGSEYDLWEKTGKWYKWLLDRILSERPSEGTDHDWNKLAIWLQFELKERNALFRQLPKPTKEQYSDKDDPDYPWTTGKWPEDAMPAIRTFAEKEAKCHDVGEKVAAILTKNEYCKKVLKQKTYKSRNQEEKARKRK
jgi:hypothetical protein